ncbi:competence/damage-inducible protein A [Akkermansia sp.]
MKNVRVELINTGTEILLGSIVNTNAAWLGNRLFEAGFRVERETVVPDGYAISEAMRESARRADVVIVSGGLGPTSDDVTREALCDVCGVDMHRDEHVAEGLRDYFKRRGISIAECNFKQAMVPDGAAVLENPNGTAPGLVMPASERLPMFILLPGPPSELKPMVERSVMPLLESMVDGDIPRLRVFRLVGIGESDLQDLVDDSLHQVQGLEVAYCARIGEVDVRLVGNEVALKQGEARLLTLAGAYVLRPLGVTLERAVVLHLKGLGLKAATAESCTGGLIAKRITDVPGSSGVFEFGWVTYADRAKTEMLGVPAEVLEEHGAVSEPVVKAMAEGALERSGADVAVAVSGFAGPDGGTPEKPVGTVWFAWAFRNGGTVTEMMFYPRDRESFRQMVSQKALIGMLAARKQQTITE